MASDGGSITYKPYRHWHGPGQQPIDRATIGQRMISVDAARAWQAFRDFLDGTAEQWAACCMSVCEEAWQAGYDRAMHDVENA